MKKLFFSVITISLFIFLSFGCMTKQVWSDRTLYPNYNQSYKEKIVSFYINTDEEKLVFIGEKYHYIFDENIREFIRLLENSKILKLSQENLNISARVDNENIENISANIMVEFKHLTLTKEEMSVLGLHFFEKYSENDYFKSYNIRGKRYIANNEINKHVFQLTKAIELDIRAPKEINRSVLKKIAMTPLTLTADAVGGLVLVGAGIVMSPIWLYKAITK